MRLFVIYSDQKQPRISHHLATIARTDLHDHPGSMIPKSDIACATFYW